MNTIITIGRQYGSGGREIGQRLAQEYVLNFTIKSYWRRQLKKVVFARNYSNVMMNVQRTVFYIPW